MQRHGQQLHLDDTLGPQSRHLPNYFDSGITRNLEDVCPEIREEAVESFAEVLDLEENGEHVYQWKSLTAFSAIDAVTCRMNNRVFVGLPLCRDPEWISFSKQCAYDIIKWGAIIGIFPKFVRPLVVRYFTNIPRNITRCVNILRPIIEERQKYLNNCDDKPDDATFLSLLMEEVNDPGDMDVERLAIPLMVFSLGGISTQSLMSSFTQALFYLAAHPQYIRPLREEVEGIVTKGGWSKIALRKMRKVDSFLRECQRMQGISTASLVRTAMKDFTFSDGTFIPKGTSIAAAGRSIHRDETFYKSPDIFKPFRFVDEDDRSNRQCVTTAPEFLSFGHGRQACPGRFLAVCEMKLMLAHIVVTYDVKLEDGATLPPSLHFNVVTAANPHAKVVFRNRVD